MKSPKFDHEEMERRRAEADALARKGTLEQMKNGPRRLPAPDPDVVTVDVENPDILGGLNAPEES